MSSVTHEMAAFVAIIGGVIAGTASIWSIPIPEYIKSLGTSLLFILLLFVYMNIAFAKKRKKSK